MLLIIVRDKTLTYQQAVKIRYELDTPTFFDEVFAPDYVHLRS